MTKEALALSTTISSMIIGLLFVLSCAAKAWHPNLTIRSLSDLGLNKRLSLITWASLLNLETQCAWNFLHGDPSTLAVIIALALIGSYSLFLISAIIRDKKSSCSCYGPWMRITAHQGLTLNLAYASIITWILVHPDPDNHMNWFELGPALGLSIGLFRLKSASSQRA
jgi:hypothetical protein